MHGENSRMGVSISLKFFLKGQICPVPCPFLTTYFSTSFPMLIIIMCPITIFLPFFALILYHFNSAYHYPIQSCSAVHSSSLSKSCFSNGRDFIPKGTFDNVQNIFHCYSWKLSSSIYLAEATDAAESLVIPDNK